MEIRISADIAKAWGRMCRIFLAFFWTFGLACGVLLSSKAAPSMNSMMCRLASSHVSIVGLLVVNFLPFILSMIALRFRVPIFILPLALVKGFLYGFSSCCVVKTFGSAGWLVRSLFIFSDSTTVLFLLWFWVRHIQASREWFVRDCAICCMVFLTVCIIDYLLVSPYLAMLIAQL